MSIDNTVGRTGSMAAVASIGPGYSPAYDLSGDPWALMLNITSSTGKHDSIRINFPSVTRFFEITNYTTGTALRIAFTENGANSLAEGVDRYYVLSGSSAGATFGPPKFGPHELRIKSLFLRAEPNDTAHNVTIRASILAGLTVIPSKNMWDVSASLRFEGVG